MSSTGVVGPWDRTDNPEAFPTFKFNQVPLSSVQFSSVAQSCPTLCNPMNCSTPGLPVHHQLPESTQTHVHQVGDAIPPSHPLSSPSPPALSLSQHQGLFKWVSSSHQVAKCGALIYFCFYFCYSRRCVIVDLALIYVIECSACLFLLFHNSL